MDPDAVPPVPMARRISTARTHRQPVPTPRTRSLLLAGGTSALAVALVGSRPMVSLGTALVVGLQWTALRGFTRSRRSRTGEHTGASPEAVTRR